MQVNKNKNDHLISVWRTDFVLINQKKEHAIEWILPLDHKVKLKKREKLNKYLRLNTELEKNLWSIKEWPLVVGALGTVLKAWKKNEKNWKSEED